MQIWQLIREQQETHNYPIGWNLMGLKYVALEKYEDPTILDRLICFDVIDKNKLTWLVMKYDLKYQIA